MNGRNCVDGRVLRCSVMVLDADADEQISFREFLVAAVHCVVLYPMIDPQLTPMMD